MAAKRKATKTSPRSAAARPNVLRPYIAPMLAHAAEPFDSDEFLFEIKWDGTRCGCYVDEDGLLRLVNRRQIEMTARYPELAGLGQLPPGTVLDGEIVVLRDGKPSFELLAQRDHVSDPRRSAMLAERLPATLVAFDLLAERGEALLDRPLEERKERLATLLRGFNAHCVVSEHVIGVGKRYFEAVAAQGLEGVMAKRRTSRYQPGKRTRDWLKIKVARLGVFEIIGFTQREGGQPFASALLLGERRGRKWHFKGKVGTGFRESDRAAWFERLKDLPELKVPPTDHVPPDAQWRATGLACRVRFFEKTVHGMLRGPVFVETVTPDAEP